MRTIACKEFVVNAGEDYTVTIGSGLRQGAPYLLCYFIRRWIRRTLKQRHPGGAGRYRAVLLGLDQKCWWYSPEGANGGPGGGGGGGASGTSPPQLQAETAHN